MQLVYCEHFPISRLREAFPRPDEWWEEHPEFQKMQIKMIESVKQDGLKYPLCAINLKDDGIYDVTVGMQRLKALQTMGEEIVRTVIAYKENQKHQPGGVVIKTATQLDEIFGCKLQGITLQPNSFEVILPDREEWRPHNRLK